MRQISNFALLTVSAVALMFGQDAESADAGNESLAPPVARTVDLKASDGGVLKATYFAAAKPGPSVLLLHQVNRQRKTWDELARQLAAAGINALTLDMRGFGESGGKSYAKLTDSEVGKEWQGRPDDIDVAFQYLISQPGVNRDVIGIGGAGLLGVDNSVQAARRHPAQVKSLALLSGETFEPNLQFLREASQLAGLFVVDDNDEYPPTVEAMEWMYISSSSPYKKLVHYSAAREAPWIWYEPYDIGTVPATNSHGTDLFSAHKELPGIIVDWFVTTLIKSPGHAPVDTLAAASNLRQIDLPGGAAQVRQQLIAARRADPKATIFPEATVDIIGGNRLRMGDKKLALEILELNQFAYPESADANANLADAYLANGQKELARQYAEKALALLNSRSAPASSWSDTEPRRGRIRHGAEQILKKLDAARQ
jgi:dienelactone hydrolase